MKHKGIIILFIIGFLIFLYPHVAQWMNNNSQKNEVENFNRFVEQLSEKEIDNIMEKVVTCNEEITTQNTQFQDPFDQEEEKENVFHECFGFYDEIFAAIEIPKLELVIPIYLGSSNYLLSKGIGQVEGSSLPLGGIGTHSVLAGHRGMGTKEMFRNIDQLVAGDIFYIHTMKGSLRYTVFQQVVIYPNETELLEINQDKDLVTLITCHPYRHNYQRLLIQAERS